MDLGLNGKRALITGATKGIGRAIAETLLAEGASVSICSRTRADVDRTVRELSRQGAAIGQVVDVADPASLVAWISNSERQLGGIDVYVHNTSAKTVCALEDWNKSFQVDLMALVQGVTAATDALVNGGGAVVSIGSTVSAEFLPAGFGAYTAFKAAVTSWTLGLAQVLGERGVRCNVVSPGPMLFEGGGWDKVKRSAPELYHSTAELHPGKEFGSPQDVADVVAFLASNRAKHINGVNVTVDGGFSKRLDL